MPITQWADLDNGFVDVAEGIAIAVEKLLEERQEQERLNLEKTQREEEKHQSEYFLAQRLENQSENYFKRAYLSLKALPFGVGEIDQVVEVGQAWRVWYGAAYWAARSNQPLKLRRGDRVKVVGQVGLTLIIEPWTNELA